MKGGSNPPAFNPASVQQEILVAQLIAEPDLELGAEQQQGLLSGKGRNSYNTAGGVDLSLQPYNVRLGFVRKVYGILLAQLILTGALVATFVLDTGVKEFVDRHQSVYWSAFAVSLATIVALSCCKECARTYPNNYILLALFTSAEGVLVGMVSAQYGTDSVLLAFGMTAIVVAGLTLFAFQTKIDVTGKGGFLFAFLVSLIVFGIFTTIFQSMQIVYSGLGVLLFSFYLVYDMQKIIGGKDKRFSYSATPI